MDNVPKKMLKCSRHIRDTLAPLVAFGGACMLNDEDAVFLRRTLDRLDAVPMTLDLLCYSRIHKALATMATDSGWPAVTANYARIILKKWENQFGPLDDLRADLWGPGGRMEGLKKTKDGPENQTEVKGSRPRWIVS
jgi:hypothetical protein